MKSYYFHFTVTYRRKHINIFDHEISTCARCYPNGKFMLFLVVAHRFKSLQLFICITFLIIKMQQNNYIRFRNRVLFTLENRTNCSAVINIYNKKGCFRIWRLNWEFRNSISPNLSGWFLFPFSFPFIDIDFDYRLHFPFRLQITRTHYQLIEVVQLKEEIEEATLLLSEINQRKNYLRKLEEIIKRKKCQVSNKYELQRLFISWFCFSFV